MIWNYVINIFTTAPTTTSTYPKPIKKTTTRITHLTRFSLWFFVYLFIFYFVSSLSLWLCAVEARRLWLLIILGSVSLAGSLRRYHRVNLVKTNRFNKYSDNAILMPLRWAPIMASTKNHRNVSGTFFQRHRLAPAHPIIVSWPLPAAQLLFAFHFIFDRKIICDP